MARLKEVLAFVNNKGGVGKTTSTHSTATALLRKIRNSRVLLIDLDAQRNLSSLLKFGIEYANWSRVGDMPTITDTLVKAERPDTSLTVYASPVTPGLYFIPSDKRLDEIGPKLDELVQPNCALGMLLSQPFAYHNSVASIQQDLQAKDKMHKETPVETGVAKYLVEEEFDYILIDCPPGHGKLHRNAMAAASGVIVPVQLEMMSVGGISNIIEEYQLVKRTINKELVLRGLLEVMVDQRLLISQTFTSELKEKYGDVIFKSVIHRSTDVSKAQCLPMSVVEFAPHSTAGSDYLDFAQELIDTYVE